MPELSKNKRYLYRTNKVINPMYKKAQGVIKNELLRVLPRDRKKEKKKIYVDILVYRNSYSSDPCNFVDGICDAIKDVLLIDDRYYAVSVDWELVKENPKIDILIYEA